MIVAPTDIWHDKREDIVCFSLLSVTFCQTISLSMLYECLPVTEMHINIHKRFEDVHNKAQNWNGQENPDLRKTASNFFLHFVVEKNWMRGVKNTCGGAWEPILFFFWPCCSCVIKISVKFWFSVIACTVCCLISFYNFTLDRIVPLLNFVSLKRSIMSIRNMITSTMIFVWGNHGSQLKLPVKAICASAMSYKGFTY